MSLKKFIIKFIQRHLNQEFNFTFDKKNLNQISNDYLKLSNKVTELEELMKTLLTQFNQKKTKLIENDKNKNETQVNFILFYYSIFCLMFNFILYKGKRFLF